MAKYDWGMVEKRAVVWDYDGTLVDSRRKNWQVTRALVTAVSGRPLETFPALATLDSYLAADRRSANWRELNSREFGLNPGQVDEAGRLWTQYQMADQTPTPLFSGMALVLEQLKELPQAIFSQNSRQAINVALGAAGLDNYFTMVVGYEEVGFARQKPAPDGLLHCIERLGLVQGTVFFVGGHDSDVACARRTNVALGRRGKGLKVVSIGVKFGEVGQATWASQPDLEARRPEEVAAIIMADGAW